MKKIMLVVLLFFSILCINLFLIPNNMDEVWNYGFSYAIRLGEIPYRDFNMVLPPFYAFLMTIPLLLWNNDLSFLIFHSLLMTGAFVLLFKMYDDYGYFLFFIAALFFTNLYPTYNSFIIALCILIIFLEKSEWKYKDYLIGFLIGLSVLTKHTVGIFFVLPSLFFWKKNKLSLSKRAIGFSVPVLLTVIYLLVTGSFIDCFDQCFLGMLSFSQNSHGLTPSFWIFILLLIPTIWIIDKHKDNLSNYYLLFGYSLFIPLFDGLHLFYVLFLFAILVGENIQKKLFHYPLFIISLILLCIFMGVDRCQGGILYPSPLSHFEYRYYPKDSITHYEKILSYLGDEEVIFYDDEAYFFQMIRSHKIGFLDLLNSGNHGYQGSQKIIQLLKEHSNQKILVNQNTGDRIQKKETQLDEEGYQYIMKHYQKIDSIENYDVYEIKKKSSQKE